MVLISAKFIWNGMLLALLQMKLHMPQPGKHISCFHAARGLSSKLNRNILCYLGHSQLYLQYIGQVQWQGSTRLSAIAALIASKSECCIAPVGSQLTAAARIRPSEPSASPKQPQGRQLHPTAIQPQRPPASHKQAWPASAAQCQRCFAAQSGQESNLASPAY